MTKTFLASLALAVLASTAQAQEITGAELSIDYSTLTSGPNSDADKLSLGASMTLGFGAFSLQGDLAQRNYALSDWNGASMGLHGIFDTGDSTKVGLFIGHDTQGTGTGHVGAEMMLDRGTMRYESFIQGFDGDNCGTGIGFAADYVVNDAFTLGGGVDFVNADDDVKRVTFDADYATAGGLGFNGQIGFEDRDSTGSEAILGLGARMSFDEGAVFARRGIEELVTGR